MRRVLMAIGALDIGLEKTFSCKLGRTPVAEKLPQAP
jgi:hypothetical protein